MHIYILTDSFTLAIIQRVPHYYLAIYVSYYGLEYVLSVWMPKWTWKEYGFE